VLVCGSMLWVEERDKSVGDRWVCTVRDASGSEVVCIYLSFESLHLSYLPTYRSILELQPAHDTGVELSSRVIALLWRTAPTTSSWPSTDARGKEA